MSNADQAQPELVMNLDKRRVFVFDWNAWCKVEEVLGGNKSFLFDINWDKLRVSDLRLLLWAGLQSDDPDLTLEQAGKLMSKMDIDELQAVIQQAVTRAIPRAGELMQQGMTEKKTGQKKRPLQ